MDSFTIELAAIPQKLRDSIARDLLCYMVGLLSIKNTSQGEQIKLIGSGTLITFGNVSGILTAAHVLRELKLDTDLGLIVPEVEQPIEDNTPKIPVKYLSDGIIGAKGPIESEGPDLSFLHIPRNAIPGVIKAKKSFFNICSHRELNSQQPLGNDFGVWFICGFPDEFTKVEESSRGFDEVRGFWGLCVPTSGISREVTIEQSVNYFYSLMELKQLGNSTSPIVSGRFDYFELPVIECRIGDKGLSSYGGVSGGGLWQVPLNRDEKEKLIWGDPILSGVAFYEYPTENGMNIKCHGRHSIYQYLFGMLKEKRGS
jgi:hypothetical protein